MQSYEELIKLLKEKKEEIKSLDKNKDELKINKLKSEVLNIVKEIEEDGVKDLESKMNICDHVFVERIDFHTSRFNIRTAKGLNYKCVSRYCLKCGCASVNINEFNYRDYNLNRYDRTVVVPSVYQRDICERTMDYKTINCYKFKLSSLIEKWRILKIKYPDFDEETIIDIFEDSIKNNPKAKEERQLAINRETNNYYIRKLTSFKN